MSDYDSGDDLFDGVDEALLLSAPASKRGADSAGDSGEAAAQKRPRLDSHASDVSADARSQLARRILKERFGYDSFRHEQEQAIASILAGHNTLAIFPTGAGKSLCYQVGIGLLTPGFHTAVASEWPLTRSQIPAVAFEELDRQDGSRGAGQHGITIVVSPLIALMKDQVDALKRRGIQADCIDSTKTWEQQQATTAAMRKGELRLLYCAPERLNNEGFVEGMKYVPGGIRLVAVDEAHCISEWGHSFRPEYLKVARFVDEIRAERVICLTATATPRVAEDVCNAFDIGKSAVFRTSPYRPNLQLQARSVAKKEEKDRLLVEFLRSHPGPALVYVTLQQQSVSVASALKRQGFNADSFHAGMKVEEKLRVQDDFMAGKITIVVATIAFGMGIDKADIRNIIHYDISSTVEEYSQQIGRAGRDGKPSTCMYFICPEDFWIRENFARGDLPSKHSLRGLLQQVFNDEVAALPVGGTFKQSHYRQSREFDIRPSPLAIIYAALELRFGLIRAITPEYSEYKFTATSAYYPTMKRDKGAEGKAIFEGSKKAVKWHQVDPAALANQYGLRRTDIVRRLNELHDQGIIELKAGGVEPRYRVLKALPRTGEEIEELVDMLYIDLQGREKDALRRVQDVAALITGEKCFAMALAQHFGMGLPDGREKCGNCVYCFTGKAVALPPSPPRAVDVDGIAKILDECDVRDDPRFLARVAFGIKSPRVAQLKLDRKAVFGSLANHDFDVSVCVLPFDALIFG
ncbi:ATP-dependent DNA helicase [Phialemonium atrogriseum]|uniref:DNA 3'-5' helicase n=1 Tax=Phialemonium atrogriseum TaxID=1093897 RepID=A0AAJ0BUS7_9PEZI|nr:ATP-dependent DNA helicase [Phialemonium atrogriseum]KAK1763432.1 ATP-dependent DNA helicase [Phialemonium atrogriseum]